MHIKPIVPLALATLCAGVGVGMILATTDPYTAGPPMLALFWIALFLTVWGLVAVILTAIHRPALGIGFLWALVTAGLLLISHYGYRNWRLSGALIFATLVGTIIVWIRSKKSAKPPLINSENSEILPS